MDKCSVLINKHSRVLVFISYTRFNTSKMFIWGKYQEPIVNKLYISFWNILNNVFYLKMCFIKV